MAEIVLTEATQGRTSVASVGDTIVVQLAETPTTGFRWTLAAVDRNVLEPVGDEFRLGPQAGVGGGGLRVLRFKAKGRGSAGLVVTLARPWESAAPKAVIAVPVDVR